MSKSVLGDLPEGVESAMFLRDGWPHAVVCKVVKGGCVGVGVYRAKPGCRPVNPEFADNAAMIDAIAHLATEPPDYSDIQEHVRAMSAKSAVAAAEADAINDPDKEHFCPILVRCPHWLEKCAGAGCQHPEAIEMREGDIQAALGQKAHG